MDFPWIFQVLAYWILGIPSALALGFGGLNAIGLWLGMLVGPLVQLIFYARPNGKGDISWGFSLGNDCIKCASQFVSGLWSVNSIATELGVSS
jgi:hypothetical protein